MRAARPLLGILLAVFFLAPGGVRAQQDQAAPPQQSLSVVVDSIVVRGNERVPDERVLEASGLRVGMQVSYPDVQDAIHRIFATGNFSDVRVLVSQGEPAVFFVLVEERPYVARYEFRGLQHVGEGTIRDTVGLADGEPLAPSKVSRAMDVTADLLADQGFPTARIDTSMVKTGDGLQLVFRVSEGPRLGLAEIEFRGNETFSDGRLAAAMATGEEGFLWFQSGELRRDQYRQDLQQRLPDFYARRGFIDFSVVDDTVIADRTTGKGKVRIRVDEGPQYRLAEFVIRGNRRYPSQALRQRYPEGEALGPTAPKPDSFPPFDQVAFQEATSQVGDLYRNAGFLRARVVPTIERLPADSTVNGDRLVRVAWNIQEGEPAYIRHVTITGNDYTHDRIIRQRLAILPGDIYSQERLVNSIRNIQSMGFFEPLPPQEAVQIEEAGNDVDITLRVKEKSTGNLNFGMSAAAGSGFAGFIGYEQPNLFGQAKRGRARLVFGGRTRDVELSYSDPQFFGTRHSVTIQLRDSRDEFRTFSVGERRQTGGALEVGTPFPGLRSTRIFVGYSLFDDETSDLSLFGVDPEERGIVLNATRSTGSIRVVRDTRQGGTFPVGGNRNMVRAAFSGNIFGGTGDFGKYEFESEWFVPVAQIGGGFESNPIQFTAGVDFRGGFILGDNPFFRERFFMGGTNIGQQLRGYEEATVTPLGHVPDGTRTISDVDRVGESFFATTAQFGAKLSQQLFINTFVDAGNVWASASQFNPTDLLVGAGFGASLITPFGPIGLDYAYGFDRRDVLGRPDPGWKLHFKFGRVF